MSLICQLTSEDIKHHFIHEAFHYDGSQPASSEFCRYSRSQLHREIIITVTAINCLGLVCIRCLLSEPGRGITDAKLTRHRMTHRGGTKKGLRERGCRWWGEGVWGVEGGETRYCSYSHAKLITYLENQRRKPTQRQLKALLFLILSVTIN